VNRAAELGRSLSPNERAGCFQIAAYRTRTPKIDAETPTEELRARWRSEAEAWGHAPERWLPEVTGRRPPAPERRIEEAAAEVIARLEERTATWTRAGVVEEVARVVTGADAELLRVAAERLTDYVLADAAVLGLASPLPVEVPATLRRRDGMAQHERHGAIALHDACDAPAGGRGARAGRARPGGERGGGAGGDCRTRARPLEPRRGPA
jgi:hypothetical protein